MEIIKGAEPFYIEGSDAGCLLLHGFTGTPKEMRPLGEYLAARGIAVLAPLIEGHGTSPAHLAKTRWHDWWRSAAESLKNLQNRCGGKKIFAAGLSMGALQTLHLGTHRPDLTGIISLAAPVFVRHWKLTVFLPLLRNVLLHKIYRYDKALGNDLKDPEALKEHLFYSKIPTECMPSLVDYMAHVREDLAEITIPILIIHSRHDHTVHPENANVIYNAVSSQDKEIVYVDNSYHVVTLDYDKEFVFDKIYQFIKKHADSKADSRQ
ncbi:MAG: alpha/beta fold hydrolase [bacterium]